MLFGICNRKQKKQKNKWNIKNGGKLNKIMPFLWSISVLWCTRCALSCAVEKCTFKCIATAFLPTYIVLGIYICTRGISASAKTKYD
jgi:hypothetical protein